MTIALNVGLLISIGIFLNVRLIVNLLGFANGYRWGYDCFPLIEFDVN